MIRFIAAIDSKRGLADNQKHQGNHGIPWLGQLPTDSRYFKQKTSGNILLMGYGEYLAQSKKPLPGRTNVVATSRPESLEPGFQKVADAQEFLRDTSKDVWVSGGAGLFDSTLDLADELYITQIDGDFHCTKFFPEFKDKFSLKSESEPITENDITYTFQVWVKNR